MISEHDKRQIAAMLLAIDRLQIVVVEHSLEEAENNFRISDVLLMEFENLANAAIRISASLLNEYPNIPINEMRAIRNRVAHDYLSVSLMMLYKTVENDFPQLKTTLIELIS